MAGLVQATDGGTGGCASPGCGTVLKITPKGTLTTLHSFDWDDGANPYAGVIQASDGNFYGTTITGGTWDCAAGCGTVFKMTPTGTLTILNGFDGQSPAAGPVQGTDGNFYGTVQGDDYPDDYGMIFQITSGGTLTFLHWFNGSDGGQSLGRLLQATNGAFYGTTLVGGRKNDGTVFGLSMGFGPFVSFVRGYGRVGAEVGILGTDLTGATGVTFKAHRPNSAFAYLRSFWPMCQRERLRARSR